MAIVNIFLDALTGRRRGTKFSLDDTIKDAKLHDFTVDVTLTENHEFQADVTENPVEEGSTITDHIDLKPEMLTITGVITDTPLSTFASAAGIGTIAGSLLGRKVAGPLGSHAGVAGGAVAGLIAKHAGTLGENSSSRTKNVFDHFRDLQAKRLPFTVLTGLREYKSMVITSLTINRDSKSGRSFNFTVALKQIRIVTSQVVKVPYVKRSTNGAGPTQDAGKKSAKELSGDTKTLALHAYEKGRDFVKAVIK